MTWRTIENHYPAMRRWLNQGPCPFRHVFGGDDPRTVGLPGQAPMVLARCNSWTMATVSDRAEYMQGVPPWDIGRSQPAFAELAERGLLAGRVLDAGCGTGEHTLMAAALGLETTGFDVSATAIAIADTKARDRGLEARFLQLNALVLSSLGEQFDTVSIAGSSTRSGATTTARGS